MKAMLQAAAMLAALFCAACSQSSPAVAPGNAAPTPPQQAAPADPALTFGLPQLPSDDEAADEDGDSHAVAIAGYYEFNAAASFRRDEPALYSWNGQPALVAGDFGPRWLMYRLSSVAQDFFPSQVEVSSLLGSDSALWVMVSDYSSARWLPLGSLSRAHDGEVELQFEDEGWSLNEKLPTYETLASPGGNLYVLLALERGLADIQGIQLVTEHEMNFPAPTGLSYEVVGENRVRFSWDPYSEPRVQRIELFRDYYSPPQSSSRAVAQGPPPPGGGPNKVASVPVDATSVEFAHNLTSGYSRVWIRAWSDMYQVASPQSESVIIVPLDAEE